MSEEDPKKNVHILSPLATIAACLIGLDVARGPEASRLMYLLGLAINATRGGGPPTGPTPDGGGDTTPNFFADDGDGLAFHIPPGFLLVAALAIAGVAALVGSRRSRYA